MLVKGLVFGGIQFWQNSTIAATLNFISRRRRSIDCNIVVCRGAAACSRDLVANQDTRECLKCVSESLLLVGWSDLKVEFYNGEDIGNVIKGADRVLCKEEDASILGLADFNLVKFCFDDTKKVLLVHFNSKILELDLFLDHAYTLPGDVNRWPNYLVNSFDKICEFIRL